MKHHQRVAVADLGKRPFLYVVNGDALLNFVWSFLTDHLSRDGSIRLLEDLANWTARNIALGIEKHLPPVSLLQNSVTRN